MPTKLATDAGGRRIARSAVDWAVAFVRTPGRALELGRYTIVSGASLALDLTVFFAIAAAAIMSPALAGALSCMAGLVLHYLLSVHVVFDAEATGKSQRRLLTEYALTGAMGFVITASAIYLAVDVAGLAPAIGKLFGIGLTFISVYLVRAGVVFAPRRPAAPTSAAGSGDTDADTVNRAALSLN